MNCIISFNTKNNPHVIPSNVEESIKQTCSNWNCKYIRIETPLQPNGFHDMFTKLYLPYQVMQFDRCMYLDTDVLIKYDASNPFELFDDDECCYVVKDMQQPFLSEETKQEFKNNQLCVVAGSTWPEGESLFINFINSEASRHVKFIIAPHDIKPERIKNLQERINSKTVLFSEKKSQDLTNSQVFIIDTVGILSKIYSYADIAYVGGAMGHTGLHNTLEPAVFGIPIIIGNNHIKFNEAQALIDNGGMFSISTKNNFNSILNKFICNSDFRIKCGSKM